MKNRQANLQNVFGIQRITSEPVHLQRTGSFFKPNDDISQSNISTDNTDNSKENSKPITPSKKVPFMIMF